MQVMRVWVVFLSLVSAVAAQPPLVGPPAPKSSPRVKTGVRVVKSVSAPEVVTVRPGRLAKVEATTAAAGVVRWINVHDALDLIESETGRWVIVSSQVPGKYRIACYADAGGPPSYVLVVVEGTRPPAPKPDDPPDPKPDDPKPKPTGGLRVLIVYESADLAKVPEAQQAILYGMTVRKALNDACEQDGTVKGWRIFDKDVDASSDTKGWADLLKRSRTSLPWVVMTRGGEVVHEGALPADQSAFLALLKANQKGGK